MVSVQGYIGGDNLISLHFNLTYCYLVALATVATAHPYNLSDASNAASYTCFSFSNAAAAAAVSCALACSAF